MRIAFAQINTTVGDIQGNCKLISDNIYQAVQAGGIDVIIFPEMAVLGYPPKDLLLKKHVVQQCEKAVGTIAKQCQDITAIIGTVRITGLNTGTGIANSAAICQNARIINWYDKRLLPTYDVFDECRYFDPGNHAVVIECGKTPAGTKIGVTICEDLWNDKMTLQTADPRRFYEQDIVADLQFKNVDVIVNLSASPFTVGKPALRNKLFGGVAQRINKPVVYVNLVGGNDDLVFDGYSTAYNPDGSIIKQAAGFTNELLIVELVHNTTINSSVNILLDTDSTVIHNNNMRDLYNALVLGVRDYVNKCGFQNVIIALSGGIDSALVAAIAQAALGSEHVRGVGMPSRYSSSGSIDDARDLAARLNIKFDLIPIEPAHQAMLDMTQPIFSQTDNPGSGIAEENIQARLRGNIVMSLSNKIGALLLTTGNKSELAVGYCTLYGDMAGGLAVISDVPKTTVYKLANWINENYKNIGFATPPIPQSTITKPPSAELKPGQLDQDSLPPYEVLDEIIKYYVEQHISADQIITNTGYDKELVIRICCMIDRNEYKRRQMPTGLKVTGRAFGSGWRMPIAAKFV